MNNTWLRYLMLIGLPFLGVVSITPLLSRYALKNKIVDNRGRHKIHAEPKALLGGFGIFICFSVAIVAFLSVDSKLISLSLASLLIVAIGLIDDLYNIKPHYKLLEQFAAAATVVLWNAGLFRFMVNYFQKYHLTEAFVLFLIIGWVVMIINAFNLIDGMDGLAAGTAAIIFLAMAALSVIEGGRPSVLGVQLIGA